MIFFEKMAKKNTVLVNNFCDKLTEYSFELKMPKFLGNHVKTHVQERIFCFLT